MKNKNEEQFILLKNVHEYDEPMKEEYFELLLNILKNNQKTEEGTLMYQYTFEIEEYESYIDYLVDPMSRIIVEITNSKDSINNTYEFLNNKGEIEYLDYENISFKMFPLFLRTKIKKLETKIDEYDDEYYKYQITFILNNHAIENIKDIILLVEKINELKDEEKIDLYKQVTK